MGQLYARDIHRERVSVFGTDATLKFFKVLPGARTQIGLTLTTKWTAQQFEDQWRVDVLEADTLPWASIRNGAEVEIGTHLGTQKFRVMHVQQPLTVGHAWVVRLEPMERV
jgi:hypothetical protein